MKNQKRRNIIFFIILFMIYELLTGGKTIKSFQESMNKPSLEESLENLDIGGKSNN